MNAFFFLHHGSTDWSDQGRPMGQHDTALDDKGRQEAEEAGKVMVGHEIASLCFSPQPRAKETAQIIAKYCHCGLYPLDGFKEQPCANEKMQTGTLPEGAESAASFAERVRQGLTAAATYPAPMLIVSDDSVLRTICALLEVEYPENGGQGIIHFFQRLGQWVAKPLDA